MRVTPLEILLYNRIKGIFFISITLFVILIGVSPVIAATEVLISLEEKKTSEGRRQIKDKLDLIKVKLRAVREEQMLQLSPTYEREGEVPFEVQELQEEEKTSERRRQIRDKLDAIKEKLKVLREERMSQLKPAYEKVQQIQFEAQDEFKEKLREKDDEFQSLAYIIGEGDVLYILVWEEKTLTQEVIVRPDGRISFPLAGEVSAAGLTFDQLRDRLTEKLEEYIRSPLVSISLKKIGGKKVIVLGEVVAPGVYAVTGKSTVLEAIAMADGFTADAVLSSTILIKGGLRKPEGRRLNLTRAIEKNDFSQNVILQPEDIIYVPKKFIANLNYLVEKIVGPIKGAAEGMSDARYLHLLHRGGEI